MHGYYDEHGSLPLCIFAGEHLLCARPRLVKSEARIQITARRIWMPMAPGFPLDALFRQAGAQLRC